MFNDRPVGVGRNSARGASQWNVNLRLNRSINLGGLLGVRRSGHARRPAAAATATAVEQQQGPGGGAGAGGGGPVQMVMMDGSASRYRLDLYVQVFNLLEHGQLQRVRRQPAVALLRAGDVSRAGAANRDWRVAELLTDR